MIINFGHNDMDQLGCQLCIHEKFHNIQIEHYSTNYKNIIELSHDIEDRIRANREDIKLLIITDISFTNNYSELMGLKLSAKEFGIPVIFIDHHLYTDNFFDDFDGDGFKVYWDIAFSASLGTYNALKLDNIDLKKLITVIDCYDIWRDEKVELFKLANRLNDYFWKYGRLDLTYSFIKSGYKLPANFIDCTDAILAEAELFYNNLKNKNLILSVHPDFSFSFIDEHFNYCVEQELKIKKIFIVASSFGALRVRFKKGGYPDELIQKIKNAMLNGEVTGHLHSFSTNLDVSSTESILAKFKEYSSIIQNELTQVKQ